ncbi:glycosidase [Sphingomonas naasensis]|uniref:Alpha-amylase n=1 Tax=Sphingomonas naasensis TaxID=1344951 RepID=A0A4S1WFL2_9SPHN|nr:alpha-amylase family glycosyl hydrolase [Sphingomonas naasensis]NIJ21679.1 glycosidase [Sphingomonas naasensis]TGX41393.1 alpha-amylase [Sphingomonas naasensis]
MKLAAFAFLAALLAAPAAGQGVRDRPPEDEVLYFLLPDRFENGDAANDRGGLKGDRLVTGFDPAAKGFYHGGDLKGLIQRLDYVEALGATAIWVAPIFRNKPVQGPSGHESAGYHGYWVTDFTRVDPHFGTNADFRALVDAAHARGIKVYMDIIVNHTADVIQYRECGDCGYRSLADYPYGRRGGVGGTAINPGFGGHGVRTAENFAKLTRPDFAYTPFVPPAEKDVKVPAWLNDPIYYHNRGNSTFMGESSLYGDFVGLDDVFTEHPRVVSGMIEIFGSWIDRFGIDGFRIDTARHVNPEFWAAFVPAMQARARAKGIPNFHIFGEVADPDTSALARHTRVDKLPSVLDFAFARTVNAVSAGEVGTDKLAAVFAADALYEGGEATALRLPTFIGNHDQGRAAFFLRKALPQASPDELLARDRLAHAMLLLLRGVPTIYSGDEQGFVGDGDDQDAREDMFPSKTAVYNDNVLLGTDKTTAVSNFDTDHPLFREIATLAKLRRAHPALTRGRQVTRYASDKPGPFAVSRFDPVTGAEVLIAFNASAQPWTGNVLVETGSTAFTALAGTCPATAAAPGSVTLTLPAFGYAVCAAGKLQ